MARVTVRREWIDTGHLRAPNEIDLFCATRAASDVYRAE